MNNSGDDKIFGGAAVPQQEPEVKASPVFDVNTAGATVDAVDAENSVAISDDLKTDSKTDMATEVAQSLTPEEVEEEALAEEEFVADIEDTIEHPLVPDENNKLRPQSDEEPEKDLVPGAMGTGDYGAEGELPFNNEEALREEKMKEEEMKKDELQNEAPVVPVAEKSVDTADVPAAPVEGASVAPVTPVAEAPATPEAPAEAPVGAPATVDVTADANTVQVSAEPAKEAAESAGKDETNPLATAMTEATKEDVEKKDEKPKKKKKVGLIVGIIVAVLLVIAGVGTAIAFTVINNKPEKKLLDGISKLIEAENLQTEVELKVEAPESSSSYTSATIKAQMSMSGEHLAAENAVIQIDTDDFGELELKTDFVYRFGEGMFFKLGGLQEVINDMVAAMAKEYSDYYSERELRAAIEEMFSDLFEAVDDTWVKIDQKELKDLDEDIAGAYDCLEDGVKKANNEEFRQKVIEAYKENSFIEIENAEADGAAEEGLSYYEIKVKADEGEKFSDAVEEMSEIADFKQCLKNIEPSSGSSDDDDDAIEGEIQDSMFDDTAGTLSDAKLFVGINSKRQIRQVNMTLENDDQKIEMKAIYSYEEKTVAAPANATKLSDFIELLSDAEGLSYFLPF